MRASHLESAYCKLPVSYRRCKLKMFGSSWPNFEKRTCVLLVAAMGSRPSFLQFLKHPGKIATSIYTIRTNVQGLFFSTKCWPSWPAEVPQGVFFHVVFIFDLQIQIWWSKTPNFAESFCKKKTWPKNSHVWLLEVQVKTWNILQNRGFDG